MRARASNHLASRAPTRQTAAVMCRGSLALLLVCAAASAQTAPATQPLSSLGGATLITLDLQKVTPKEAFDRLERVSNLHIVATQPDLLSRSDDKTVTAHFENESYLSAVLDLCGQSNVQINTIGSRLMLVPAADGRSIPPHVAAGPLEIFCNAVSIFHEIHYGEHDRPSAYAALNFSVIGEARVPVVSIDGAATSTRAIDDRGQPLAPAALPRVSGPAVNVVQNGVQSDVMSDNRFFAIQLAIDPAASRSVALLQGSVIARVIAKSDSLTIKDLMSAEGTTTKLGESTFTVTKIEQAGPPGQYQVDLDVTSTALSPNFFARVRFSDSPFVPKLEPGGNIVRLSTIQARPDGVTVALQVNIVPQPGEKRPFNLVWPLPSEVRRVEVPFEFHNLKLH